MDPKWRKEKLRREDRSKLNTYADGDEITQNLRRFAQERRDVFPNAGQAQSQNTAQTTQASTVSAGASGQGDQQKIIWDGQTTGVTRTTANIAMLQHQQARNLTEAFEIRGQLDQKYMDKLNKANNPVPTVKNIQNAIISKEQMRQQQAGQIAKKPIEDDEDEALNYLQTQLRSEAEWLRLFPGKLNIKVRNTVTSDGIFSKIPFNACEINYHLNTDNLWQLIDPIKRRLNSYYWSPKQNLNQLLNNFAPISHIRLSGQKNLPMKDNLTLSFYNTPDGAILELCLKKLSKYSINNTQCKDWHKV
ncbi:Surp module family protein [Oxytricha trifallax]|uniref:Surp module family protein n=1 Tax=Oxytricha trifallax TaxID=1172189 RepID=A0A073I010_9SPIT|nr:Surp module family protein [Oxytricha trifallax]